MLPCSTSPAVAPVAAATAAAAAVTEAGEVVCLLPTVKSPVPNQTRRKSRFTRGGGEGGGRRMERRGEKTDSRRSGV